MKQSLAKKEMMLLKRIAKAVQDMPFGESTALPWCRESFPELDQAMKDWEINEDCGLTSKVAKKRTDLPRMVNKQTAYVTKSMHDDTPRYPQKVHLIKSLDLCYCGTEITGPHWLISIDDKNYGNPATCQKCLKEALKYPGK
jgi:hypothetical protein